MNDETDVIEIPICPYKYSQSRKSGMYITIDKTICDDCEGRGSYGFDNRLVRCAFFIEGTKKRLEGRI